MLRPLSRNICVVVFTFFFTVAYCQVNTFPQLRFEAVTIENGLSNNRTTDATKDTSGFLWFATDDGICRFDGLSTKKYNFYIGNDEDEFNQQFAAIYCDKSGKLWAAAYRFLKFNYDTEKLEFFFDTTMHDQPYRVRQIFEDKDNKLWLAARNGFFTLDTDYKLYHFPPDREKAHYEIWDILKHENLVCLGTRSNGLVVYNLNDSTYTKIPLYNEFKKEANIVLSLFLGVDSLLWVGTKNNGLFKLDISTLKVVQHLYPDKNVKRIRDITGDNKNNIWFATMDGLYLLQPGSHEFKRYAYLHHPISNITHNSVFKVLIDNNEMMWLCTYAGGINYCNIKRKLFHTITEKQNNDSFLNNAIVSGFIEDKKNNVYVGTDRGGLNYWNRTSNTFSYIPHDQNKIGGTNIKCLATDDSGNIWIGTYAGGVTCYNPDSKKFTYYSADTDENFLQGNNVFSLFFDKEKNLWIGSEKGVDFLDHKTNIIKPKHSFNGIHVLHIDDSNKIWMGIDGKELFCFDAGIDQFLPCFQGFNIQSIKTIFRDSGYNLWIGGKHGIKVIDIEKNELYTYDNNNGLSSNIILGIIEDNQTNIWVSTSSGLMKLSKASHSPNNFKIITYKNQDGLQSNQFWQESVMKSTSGELFFGGIKGFNHFFPEDIEDNPYTPKLVFTGLKISNKTVKIGQKINDDVVLEKSVNQLEEITLGHKQKIFTLEFVALHFADAEHNKYKYKLEPFEKEWNYVEYPRNFATYSALPAGEYTFLVEGANSDGVWNPETLRLKIWIKPPYWKTWWFKLLVFLTLISILSTIVYRRIDAFRRQKIKLEGLVKQRTKEIEDYNVELLRQQAKILIQTKDLEKQTAELRELNLLKDRLFSIIAHDLKNPFQNILGFSKMLMINYARYPDEKKQNFIMHINDSAQRIYELLENLLSWSRSQTGDIPFKPQTLDLSKIVDQCKSLFDYKMGKKNITLFNKIDPGVSVFADWQMLESVINNLISNAIKFTNSGGEIMVGSKELENKVQVFVKDDGVGIDKEISQKLFISGNAGSSKGTEGEPGTGLGLMICKEFVEKNGGEIRVESEKGKGTTFLFTVLKNQHKRDE